MLLSKKRSDRIDQTVNPESRTDNHDNPSDDVLSEVVGVAAETLFVVDDDEQEECDERQQDSVDRLGEDDDRDDFESDECGEDAKDRDAGEDGFEPFLFHAVFPAEEAGDGVGGAERHLASAKDNLNHCSRFFILSNGDFTNGRPRLIPCS